MVMQIFQIIPLEATKNIFINSLACFLGVTQIWKKGGWDYITFNSLREETSSKIQMYARAAAEWIHDPIFVEYSRVCGTNPGFPTHKSLNSFSIRKTKGKLLKATQSFELNWRHHTSILSCFLCGPRHDRRCTNFDILNNKCPARLTNISADLDILPHRRKGRNLTGSMSHTVSSPLLFLPVYHLFFFSHKSFHAITQRQWEVFQSISRSWAVPPLLCYFLIKGEKR